MEQRLASGIRGQLHQAVGTPSHRFPRTWRGPGSRRQISQALAGIGQRADQVHQPPHSRMPRGRFGDHRPSVRVPAQHHRPRGSIQDLPHLRGIVVQITGGVADPAESAGKIRDHTSDSRVRQVHNHITPRPRPQKTAVHQHRRRRHARILGAKAHAQAHVPQLPAHQARCPVPTPTWPAPAEPYRPR
ncbi:hypothetical protein BJ970_005823 [Saccharopolyspora phatthalungensis]|uniref:Uncharacterized protein n=1 Tax=Saccharopolyspora phatthalungensis TaxID=664693 RepID=A0A840QBV1_9PSEU|nr:hypothetical protein [Saccharopolyspora phatthalungensis]MBB5158224.1 hypothetical protein [Saccharopolyspora phatthalungensis]